MELGVVNRGQVQSTVSSQDHSASAVGHDISPRIQMPPCCDFPINREGETEDASVEDNTVLTFRDDHGDRQRLAFVSEYVISEIQNDTRLMQRAIEFRDSFRATCSRDVTTTSEDGEISESMQNALTQLDRMLQQANELYRRVSWAPTLAIALSEHQKAFDLVDQGLGVSRRVHQLFHSREPTSRSQHHHDLMRDISIAINKINNAYLFALDALAHYPGGLSRIQASADENEILVIGENEVPETCDIQASRYQERLERSSIAPVTDNVRGIPGTSEDSQGQWESIWRYIGEEGQRLDDLSNMELRISPESASLESDLRTGLASAEEEADRVLETLSAADAEQAYQRFRAYYDVIIQQYNAAVQRFGGSTSLRSIYIDAKRAYLRCVGHLVNRHCIEGDWDYIARRASQFNELNGRRNRSL